MKRSIFCPLSVWIVNKVSWHKIINFAWSRNSCSLKTRFISSFSLPHLPLILNQKIISQTKMTGRFWKTWKFRNIFIAEEHNTSSYGTWNTRRSVLKNNEEFKLKKLCLVLRRSKVLGEEMSSRQITEMIAALKTYLNNQTYDDVH